jgi:hypothetical protein
VQDDVRIEHQERFEVNGAYRRHDCLDGAAVSAAIDGHVRGLLDAAACTARALPGGEERSSKDSGDVVERHVEHVVQNVSDTLGRGERLNDHERRFRDP